MRAWTLLLPLLVPVCLTACSDSRPAGPERPNVVLVIVDTLRADKLGCYGSDLGATPALDEFAAHSVRFENAYSHAPWTLPSCASLLTAMTPPQHNAGGQLGHFRRLGRDHRTVAECFADAGYDTACIVNVDFLGPAFGLTQGFDHIDFVAYSNNVQTRSATATTDAALAWLSQQRRRPFFLLVHYFDPHLIYDPPLEFRRRFAHRLDRDNEHWVFGTRAQLMAFRRGKRTFSESLIRRAEQLYNGEVAYTDQEVGRLLDEIAVGGQAGQTVIVFTADHGEEFYDHRGFEHGHTLYNELVHIPLMIHHPGRFESRVVEQTVGHIDVAPTLCALAGVETPEAFHGRSLVPLLNGTGAWESRPLLLWGNFWGLPLRGWLHNEWKLIETPEKTLLFNVRRDPGEWVNLASSETERVQRMQADLALATQQIKPRGSKDEVQLTPEQRERLRALGYISE